MNSTKPTTRTVLSLPVSIASIRSPAKLQIIGTAGTRRHGDTTVETLEVRCGCFRVFTASRVQIEQGLISCCDHCYFERSEASVRTPRPASCRGRAR